MGNFVVVVLPPPGVNTPWQATFIPSRVTKLHSLLRVGRTVFVTGNRNHLTFTTYKKPTHSEFHNSVTYSVVPNLRVGGNDIKIFATMRFTIHPFQILFKQLKCIRARNNTSCRCQHRSAKRTHPSADRNSQPIFEALRTQLDLQTPGLHVLEISSGSGQHAGYLAPLFPNITFQPTEYDRDMFDSIRAYAADCPTKNIRDPLFIDVSQHPDDWKEAHTLRPASFDYMFNFNMIHISPWPCTLGLFRAAKIMLKPHGTLFTYGAYALNGVLTPQSNVNFDRSLKSRNPEWGVRDIVELKKVAAANGLELKKILDLPSNNKFLTWVKQA